MDALVKTIEAPLKESEMWWGTLGTVRPFPNFRAAKDVRDLQMALENKACDVNTVVRILTNRSNEQRQSIAEFYHNVTHKDLCLALKKVLSGPLEELLLGLMLSPAQYGARRLRRTMEGLGTDEEGLLEVLCTMSPQQLKDIAIAYREEFGHFLEKDLISETRRDFTKLVLAILKKEEPNTEGRIDYRLIDQDTKALNTAVSSKKVDPGPWIEILTTRNSDHLNRVLWRLEDLRRESVDKTVQTHFSGDLKLGFRILVGCIQSVAVYLAQRLQTSMKKSRILQWILISQCEDSLLCVRMEYLKLTNTSLYSALEREFRGELQQALLALCRSQD